MFDYLNIIEVVIAFASLVVWGRFATFVANDVNKNLVRQKEITWNLATAGIMLVMFVVWVTMPMFVIGLVVNLIVVGAFIGVYWKVRVEALGPVEGHLLAGLMASLKASKASSR